jgi:exopolyphosphatase/guanosine-5'-triphosphate,3'-diphosphate pyrophosphatase
MTKLPRNVAFLDIGTNSIRLLLVRINPNFSISILTQQKEVVRLGEGEFVDQTLQPLAMHRAVLVSHKFCEMARSRSADEIIAVATSATREAINKKDFVHLLNEKARIKVHVISGLEEARLIYLGVSSGYHLGDRQALFIDIGGGSTEMIVGNQQKHLELGSIRMGAIRLSNEITLSNKNGVVSPQDYELMRNIIRSRVMEVVKCFQPYQLDLAIGSSGTIINLAEISSKMFNRRHPQQEDVMVSEDLKATIQQLCIRDLEERRLIPGINPERADIIIPGAAILDVIMDELHLPSITISQRGLRDGLLVDYLSRNKLQFTTDQISIRERSILQLARTGMVDEVHAKQVRNLALQMFDSAGALGLHHLDSHLRELLGYSALLHDVGSFLNYNNHHMHSYYLIRNAELLGFDQSEISIMANTAFYHRKSLPGRKQQNFLDLNSVDQDAVKVMSMFLRLSESLDRSHRSVITKVSFAFSGENATILEIVANQDAQLEIWGVENHIDAFRKTFGLNLIIKQGFGNQNN